MIQQRELSVCKTGGMCAVDTAAVAVSNLEWIGSYTVHKYGLLITNVQAASV